MRLPASGEEIRHIIQQIVISDATLFCLHSTVDEIAVIFLGNLLVFFLEDTIVALKKVLLDEYLLEFLPDRLQLVAIIFIFSDQLFHLFLVDAVVFIGLQTEYGVFKFPILTLKFAYCHFQPLYFYSFGLVGRFSLVCLRISEKHFSVPQGGNSRFRLFIAIVPGSIGEQASLVITVLPAEYLIHRTAFF